VESAGLGQGERSLGIAKNRAPAGRRIHGPASFRTAGPFRVVCSDIREDFGGRTRGKTMSVERNP